MEIVNGHPAARIRIRRRRHAILAVESRKNDLTNVGARCQERTALHPFGQVLPEAMHDFENLLCRFLVVGHLHCHRTWLSDGLNEKSRRHIGRDSQLPSFQNDASLSVVPRKLQLCPVRPQRNQSASFTPNLEQTFNEQISHRNIRAAESRRHSRTTFKRPQIQRCPQISKQRKITHHSQPSCPCSLCTTFPQFGCSLTALSVSQILGHENQRPNFPTRTEQVLIDTHNVILIFGRERGAAINHRRRLRRSRIYRRPHSHVRVVGCPSILLSREQIIHQLRITHQRCARGLQRIQHYAKLVRREFIHMPEHSKRNPPDCRLEHH